MTVETFMFTFCLADLTSIHRLISELYYVHHYNSVFTICCVTRRTDSMRKYAMLEVKGISLLN